jgi:hypothetical protein
MDEQEEYLDGIESEELARGMIGGYGLYATTKRLIGVSRRKQILEAEFLGLPGTIKLWRDEKKEYSKLEKGESQHFIEDLLKSKDFEANKNDIKLIILMRPSRFKRGHLKILLKSGEDISLRLGTRAIFERVGEIMQSFSPGILKRED